MTHGSGDLPTIDAGGYSAENVSLPLNFTAAAWTSRLWGTAPPDVIHTLANQAVTMNLHEFGIEPSAFNATPPLSSRFSILSTNLDLNGREFVSSTEGKDGLPIFTTQFHPEKPQFEWYVTGGGGSGLKGNDEASPDARLQLNMSSDHCCERSHPYQTPFASQVVH